MISFSKDNVAPHKILHYLNKHSWIPIVVGLILGLNIQYCLRHGIPRKNTLRKGAVWEYKGYTYGIAWDYTNLNFWRVRKGMTRKRIYELLGPPIGEKRSASWEVWCYALEYPEDKPLRRLILFKNGMVEEKVSTGWIIL